MTTHETAALELAAVLFVTAAVPLAFAARWAARRFRWPAFPAACAAFCLALCAAAYALADGEPGKPAPPQVARWMRFKKEWAKWTNEVKHEWSEFCSAIRQGFISVQGLYGDTLAATNSLPANAAPPKTMRLRANLINNPKNDNFKARPTRLTDNGDGTWTVEITMSREVTDEPALIMYLRRRDSKRIWTVEHSWSSFPTNSSLNAYAYTFQMPVNVVGSLAVADEVLLGGPSGLQVEGLALVDLDAGMIYEGVDGDYVDADGRPLQVRGGVFQAEAAKAQSAGEPGPEPMPARQAAAEPAPLLTTKTTAATTTAVPAQRGGMPRDAVILRDHAPEPEPAAPPLKLAMPPLDGGAK